MPIYTWESLWNHAYIFGISENWHEVGVKWGKKIVIAEVSIIDMFAYL